MTTKIIIAALLLTATAASQNIYEVTPGTKGNEIQLTLSNVSEAESSVNVTVTLINKVPSIDFTKETKSVELIAPEKEEILNFKFDINRNIQINKKDTIKFLISDDNGFRMMKSFIFEYTAPKDYKLEQNFPNPFNPTTTIQYQLPIDSKVALKVYDILGSEVMTLVNQEQEAGYKEVKFNASHFASGMYIYRLQAGDYSSIKKMLLIK